MVSENEKWYRKTWVIVLFSIFIPPVGIVLAWINPNYSSKTKWIFTGVLAIWFIMMMASSSQDTKPATVAKKPTPKISTKAAEPIKQKSLSKSKPKPKAKPKSLKNKIAEIVNDKLGEETNNDKKRLKKIDVYAYVEGEDGPAGSKLITVEYNGDDNLTTNLTKGSLTSDAEKIIQPISKLDSSIYTVVINAFLPLTDKFGNTRSGKVMTITLDKPTWQKINWENFIDDDFPDIADFYWEHPLFKQ